MSRFDHMVLSYDSNDMWNSGFRDQTRSKGLNYGSMSVNPVVNVPDERFVRSAASDTPSTAEYQVFRGVPEIAADLTRAINDNDTAEAQKLGDQLDGIAKEYSPYITDWASIDTRNLDSNSAVVKLANTARVLNEGSWKTNTTSLMNLAGGTTALPTTYNDFVNFDSEASVKSRKADFTHNWKFNDELSNILSDRTTNSDGKSTLVRDLTDRYIKTANSETDSLKSLSTRSTMSSKVRMVYNMLNSLSDQDGNTVDFDDPVIREDVTGLVESFMGADPTGNTAPSLKEFQACAKLFFNTPDYDGNAYDFAREWKEFVKKSANKTEYRGAPSSSTDTPEPQLATVIRSRADENTAAALTTILVKNFGYSISGDAGTELNSLVKNIIGSKRALEGSDVDNGISNKDWASYGHYVFTGRQTDSNTESVRKVQKLFDTHRAVQSRLATDLAIPDVTIGGQTDGKNATPSWLTSLAPTPNMTRSAEQDLARAIAPSIVSAMYRSPDGILGRDAVFDIINKADAALIRNIKSSTATNEDKEKLTRKIADYYYAKVTGDLSTADGQRLTPGHLSSLMDYADVIISGTSDIDENGNKVSRWKEVPEVDLSDLNSTLAKSFNSSEKRDVPSVDVLIGKEITGTNGFDEFMGVLADAPDANTNENAWMFREAKLQPAGTKLLMNAAADKLELSDEVKKLFDKDPYKSQFLTNLTKMFRAQHNTVHEYSKESALLGEGTDDIDPWQMVDAVSHYKQVFTFAEYIAKDIKQDDTSLRSLEQRAFSQDIAMMTLLNLLQSDDGPMELGVFQYVNNSADVFAPYRTLCSVMGPDFANEAVKWFDPHNRGWSTTGNHIDEGTDVTKIFESWQKRRDERFNRLNPNYTGSFFRQNGIAYGKGYDPSKILETRYKQQVAKVQSENKERQRTAALQTGGVEGLFTDVLERTVDINEIYEQAVNQVVANANHLGTAVPKELFVAGHYRDNVLSALADTGRKLQTALGTGDNSWRLYSEQMKEISKGLTPVIIRSADASEGQKFELQVKKGRDLGAIFDQLPPAIKNMYRGAYKRQFEPGRTREFYTVSEAEAKEIFIKGQAADFAAFMNQVNRQRTRDESADRFSGRSSVETDE